MRRQNSTGLYVGNIAAALLVKTDQRTTFRPDMAHTKTRPMTITPGRTMNWRQHRFRTHPADMPQTVLQHPLLGSNLGSRIHVLHGTAAANTKMRTARFDASWRGLKYSDQLRQFIIRLSPKTGVLNRFSR